MPPLKSSFDWRVNFSAMAFRIIGTPHKSGTRISPLWVNRPLNTKICDKTVADARKTDHVEAETLKLGLNGSSYKKSHSCARDN